MARPRAFDTDEVLKQSMTVFWAKGYKGASMEDLMAATGLNKQSLYGAFGDKRELFLKAMALYRQTSAEKTQTVLNAYESAWEGIHELFMMLAGPTECGTKGCLLVNISLEFGTDDPDVLDELKRSFDGFEARVQKAVERGQAQGEITTKYPSSIISKTLISTIGGLRVLEKRGESYDTIKAILAMVLDSIRA